MLEVRRAARLLDTARNLLASVEPDDSQTVEAARDLAREALDVLSGTHRRSGRMLVAEATELSALLDRRQELELSIGGLIGAAAGYLELHPSHESKRGAARVARALAAIYGGIGMRQRAAQFALEYLKTLPESDRDLLAIAYTVCALAAADAPDQLVTFVPKHNPADLPEPIRSMLVVLAQRTGHRPCSADELFAAARMLRHLPTDLGAQCALFAANGLLRLGHPARAAELLTELCTAFRADPMTEARLMQASGIASARAGNLDVAMRDHLTVWTRYDDQRYRMGSSTLRRALNATLLRSRKDALAFAAKQADWRLLLELIEACRLQATSDLTGSADELDQTLATGLYNTRPSTALRKIDPETLPAPYQDAVGDLFDSRADVTGYTDVYVGGVSALAEARAADGLSEARSRLDAEQVMRRHSRPQDLWWSSWCEDGLIYWVLSRDSRPFTGGVINLLSDDGLCQALSIASLRYKITPSWQMPPSVRDFDLTGYLEFADASEELAFTSALTRLLPAEVREHNVPGQRLLLSCAAELAPIPWPILPVDMATSPVTRLIERFELRFLPSLAILDQFDGRATAERRGELPFLLACDYFPTDGPADPPLARRARSVLTAKERCAETAGSLEARATNVVQFMRTCTPGTEGVVFFRTHYHWAPNDPGSSGVALADGVLPSGLLAARDQRTGHPLLGLPSTVVMSCCSTSGGRERNGGESLGFAPLAMLAGARRLIVTSVNIEHTSFTLALDDMLIDLAVQPDDHFAGLRELQLRLLEEWRRHSPPGALRNTTPLPSIWAHFQAFGA
ncbi:CHAT domain-containing protein [Streptomyces cyanogenus]|uniref:CHAT domain protein n=1 Tax=Streptomyces cyanogenus TaxID=80860 RepID=A0ABX7U4J6_STRCY|nr:CHAT domain-containing protein [Streptomyces cyanogenus]QTE03134.1 CHAT domain protein [Streptomyces cyanogenus]